MSKFNKSVPVATKINNHPEATTNHEGGLHFNTSAEMDLYLRVTTGFLDDKFYEKSAEVMQGIRDAIKKVDRSFVLKLANYARNKMYLRSVSTMLLAEAAHTVFPGEAPNASKSIVSDYATKIISRADEINEVLAYSINILGKGHKAKLANSLKKGVARAFNKFDEYSFAKYNRGGKGAITFKDAIRLVHPKPKDDQQKEIFKRIVEDNLTTPETWEVEISGKGSTAENWNAIAPKMGIMAKLRNLRNFEEKGAEEALKLAYADLSNKEKVLNSKLLPFRFFSASREVGRNATRDALNNALDIAVENLPKIKGNVAVFADTSGSMTTPVSAKSKVNCLDIATLFGAMVTNMVEDGHDYLSCAFATDVGEAQISKRDSVLTNQAKINGVDTNGCGTNAWKVIPYLRKKNFRPDVVVVFSDMQCYTSGGGGWGYGRSEETFGVSPSEQSLSVQWEKYKREVNPNAVLVSVHLNGYGGSQFPSNAKDVILLSGWSENILSFISAYQDRVNILNEIKNNY